MKTPTTSEPGSGASIVNRNSQIPLLPLLLHRRRVLELLDGFTPDLVYDYRRDGDLRVFRPDPDTAWAYYYTLDVARIHGHMQQNWNWNEAALETLPEELTPEQFEEVSGLAPRAFWTACRCRTLASHRTPHGLRVPRQELKRFV
jgi:hypothetical protein